MSKQILFRMENDLLQQLSEKLQSIGMTKQHFFNRVSELFVEGKIDINGTTPSQTDYREQTRDDFDYIKDAILHDSDFVSALSRKLTEPLVMVGAGKGDDNLVSNESQTVDRTEFNVGRDSDGNNEENEAVNSSQTVDLKGSTGAENVPLSDYNPTGNKSLNGACNVPDYVIEKLRSLPHKLSNSALEKALGIPSTYLSKRGNKSVERKLEEYKDFLSALTPPNGTDKKWTNPYCKAF